EDGRAVDCMREADPQTPPSAGATASDADDTAAHRLRRASAVALPRGTCVGRYLIVELLGEGGMGQVYRAYDPELHRSVALTLRRAGGTDRAHRDPLLREAQALRRLSHPNVVAIHDVGTFDDQVFLAMEFVEGATLRRWLRAAPRRQSEIIGAFLAAGEGL